MKIKKIVKISLQRLRQNKKRNMIIVVPIILIVIILLMLNMIQYSVKEYIIGIADRLDLRETSQISYSPSNYENILEKIKDIEHVQMVKDEYGKFIIAGQYCKEFKSEKSEGEVRIEPANNKACPEVIEGRRIQSNDKYVIILPDKIEISNSENEYIDAEKFIGKELTIIIEPDKKETTEKTFKVIGIYDSKKYSSNKILYIPIETIREINKEVVGYSPNGFYITLIVDKMENVEKVENELHEKGLLIKTNVQNEKNIMNGNPSTKDYQISKATGVMIETQKLIKKMMMCLVIAIVIISITLLVATNISKTYLSMTEIGILKIEGYTNSDIQKILIIETIIICIISIIISLIIFGLLIILLNMLFDYIIQKDTINLIINDIKHELYYIRKIPQKISISFFVTISLIIIAIQSINTFLINKRILSKEIKDIIKNNG